MAKKLAPDFFLRSDVVSVAQDLLGCLLVTQFDGVKTSGVIVETEAYRGPDDMASHSYQNRRTKRNDPMFAQGGIAYVYLCYGIHHLFNVVAGSQDEPHAVLIRALSPKDGIETMQHRRRQKKNLTSGPGVLSQALGMTLADNRTSLQGSKIWIEHPSAVEAKKIVSATRVGVEYAGEDAKRLWRFYLQDSPWVSKI